MVGAKSAIKRDWFGLPSLKLRSDKLAIHMD